MGRNEKRLFNGSSSFEICLKRKSVKQITTEKVSLHAELPLEKIFVDIVGPLSEHKD